MLALKVIWFIFKLFIVLIKITESIKVKAYGINMINHSILLKVSGQSNGVFAFMVGIKCG